MPAASTATRTNRRCTSIWCRRRTSRATRTCCARAAATSGSPTTTASSTPSGRCGRIPEPTARIRPASIAPDGIAGEVHVGLRAARLPRRSAAGGALRQRLRRGARGQPGQPHRARRRRHDAARAQGVRPRRVPRVDRRALPSGLSRPTRPTARCTSPTCIAGSSSIASRITDVPARSDPRAQAGAADRAGPHLSRRARHDAARHRRAALAHASPAQLVDDAVASERLAARHGAAAAGRARRQGRSCRRW